ncbi:MAG: type II toxin-antitoxin system mRNA interferase toxin, RelE/StbE family [Planctomycetota bacterium]|nr:MAG: type II toxin-antitoxin system mRNA interferase toxin, RelE/StbE family [Planctomycetota bacterium]
MARYRITIKKSAAKELEDIPKKDLAKIVKRIQSLGRSQRPHGCQKLSGQNRLRIRHRDYRIIYSIDDKDCVVNIVKIGHRREIYR